jgi:hypothetical protein
LGSSGEQIHRLPDRAIRENKAAILAGLRSNRPFCRPQAPQIEGVGVKLRFMAICGL